MADRIGFARRRREAGDDDEWVLRRGRSPAQVQSVEPRPNAVMLAVPLAVNERAAPRERFAASVYFLKFFRGPLTGRHVFGVRIDPVPGPSDGLGVRVS